MDAPRDNLIRSAPFELIRAEREGDGLTMQGYAAVFNSRTEINSWEGNFYETIMPGAFKKTLRERTPVLMFDHGQHPLIGSMPLGSITKAREDEHGVYVEARLADNWLIQPVRDAIEQRAISGMSFRFSVVRDEWVKPAKAGGLRNRSVLELRCPELGPVVFPAYQDTAVGVRSQQLVTLLADPEVRQEVARALFAGNDQATSEDAAELGTSDEAGEDLEPQVQHSSPHLSRHAALAAMAKLKETRK
jgi:HK97 family phage prohead protease